MEGLLAVLIVTWLLSKAVGDTIVDTTLAKQGKVSPRLEAKYGDKAGAMVKKYGPLDFFRDAWNDYWPRRTEALIAARDAKAANPGERVRLRDRLAAAKAAVTAKAAPLVEKAKQSPVVQKLVQPVGKSKPTAVSEPAESEPVPRIVDGDDADEGTRRFNDAGQQEEYRDGRWQPVPKNPDSPPEPPAKQPTPSTGGPMTAPTGEAVNYETTVAELEALANEQRGHVDQCAAALQAIGSAKAAIGDMQESYRASAAAAASTAEHLAAKNLDGVTLANAGTTVDAMPAGKVDEMFDQLELMEAEAQQRLADAEVALAATETNLQHIQGTYGDAHATVAGNLGGDSSFLDAGGGAAPMGALEREIRFDPNDLGRWDEPLLIVTPAAVSGSSHRQPNGDAAHDAAHTAAREAGMQAVDDRGTSLSTVEQQETYRQAYDQEMRQRGFGPDGTASV
ncbi:hypothetical protein Drose_06005 [Dactylosporangium roseum]|uniref:Uncharacterized protein n=1 Tax=Dactylosporangium roseum TaxID=47989 RepID=A0ABY5Z6Z4_9ACTN|nr:hypothetical protein [Dactylosporangium roseum]UWZ37825.1 hypothetical protein Drose_06005 [Dactylosporangium roseum]